MAYSRFKVSAAPEAFSPFRLVPIHKLELKRLVQCPQVPVKVSDKLYSYA